MRRSSGRRHGSGPRPPATADCAARVLWQMAHQLNALCLEPSSLVRLQMNTTCWYPRLSEQQLHLATIGRIAGGIGIALLLMTTVTAPAQTPNPVDPLPASGSQ